MIVIPYRQFPLIVLKGGMIEMGNPDKIIKSLCHTYGFYGARDAARSVYRQAIDLNESKAINLWKEVCKGLGVKV